MVEVKGIINLSISSVMIDSDKHDDNASVYLLLFGIDWQETGFNLYCEPNSLR